MITDTRDEAANKIAIMIVAMKMTLSKPRRVRKFEEAPSDPNDEPSPASDVCIKTTTTRSADKASCI